MKNYKHKRNRRGTVSHQKPNNSLRQRVREIGGDKFGLLVVDSAKHNFCVQLANFYGEELWGPETVANTQAALDNLVKTVMNLMQEHKLKELVVGIEQTGCLHRPIKHVLEKRWQVKMIHPFTTKQLRQPVHSGTKTDAIDLDAMIRGMISGYGSEAPHIPEAYRTWQCVNRAREDWVKKRACLKAQCQDIIQVLMPGYSKLFDDIWTSQIALAVIKEYGLQMKILRTNIESVSTRLRQLGISFQMRTLHRIRAWALETPSSESAGSVEHQILCEYLELIRSLALKIDEYEVLLLEYLVMNPGVLLMSIPGVNVSSSSGYASELGPVNNYPSARHINGRAGLYPSRYQSDEVNHPDGPIVKGHNARLRDGIMEIAINLKKYNDHFFSWAELRKKRQWPNKKINVSIGNRFTRISYHMMTTRDIFRHPCCPRRDSVLAKIFRFAAIHRMTPEHAVKLAEQTVWQLPVDVLLEEAQALEEGKWRQSSMPREYGLPRTSTAKELFQCVPSFIHRIEQIIKQLQGGQKCDIIPETL